MNRFMNPLIVTIAMAAAPAIANEATRTHASADYDATVRTVAVPEGAVTIPGVLKPWREATLGAPVEDTLSQLLVEEGDRVTKGQAIARFDDRVEAAALAAAKHAASRRGRIEGATAARDLARLLADKTRAAHARNAATAAELDLAAAELESAEAELLSAQEELQAARHNLRLAQARLDRRTILAPFDAIVTRVHAAAGESLNNGDPVAHIEATGSLRAELRVDHQAVAQLTPGRLYALRVTTGEGETIVGRLAFVDRRVEPASRSCRAVFRVDEHPAHVMAGALVIPANTSQAPAITSATVSRTHAQADARR